VLMIHHREVGVPGQSCTGGHADRSGALFLPGYGNEMASLVGLAPTKTGLKVPALDDFVFSDVEMGWPTRLALV
jgi:hypothetical protein